MALGNPGFFLHENLRHSPVMTRITTTKRGLQDVLSVSHHNPSDNTHHSVSYLLTRS